MVCVCITKHIYGALLVITVVIMAIKYIPKQPLIDMEFMDAYTVSAIHLFSQYSKAIYDATQLVWVVDINEVETLWCCGVLK